MLNRFSKPIVACLTLLAASMSAVTHAGMHTPDRNLLTIIGYHEITDHERALIPQYAIKSTQFAEQIQSLKKDGFHFISVDQLIKANQGSYKLPKKPLLLTVDDGYQSFYKYAYPIVKEKRVPVVLSVVGSWIETQGQQVSFGDQKIPRSDILTWAELKEMQDSGYVEIGNHSYDLHRGILGNPQGNSEPAATTRLYSPESKSYESDQAYATRIYTDLKKNNEVLQKHGIRSPRVMVWPYGQYNMKTVEIAKQLGMPITITLDDGGNNVKQSLSHLNRILVESDTTRADLLADIKTREMGLNDNNRAQKIMHVDLDYLYDPDPAQEEKNIGLLLDRIQAMKVNTVYLQAFSDPDADGSADMVYFPNRYLPMRADLFNRVAWQIQSRTQVNRLYAWMPLLAWQLPENNPVSKHLVVTQQAKTSDHLNMGYHRLSPYSPQAREVIRGIYEDLAKSSNFNGILFHDDTTLSDYEDSSDYALSAYKAAGISTDLEAIRQDEAQLQKWTAFKTKTIDDFAMQLADEIRYYHPYLVTARNLYAQVALNAYSENWYAQSLEQSLKRYDFTAIMAMPYMEQAEDKEKFFNDLVKRVKSYPQGLKKTVFELQATNWRNNQPVPAQEMADTIKSLYQQGAMHIAYYPDDPFKNHPDPKIMRDTFGLKTNRLVP
ncbi:MULTISPECIES: poly-beta-1,6-N-acetyl-D-glucosamine N-deacetylase PgaB [Acinetobacter]|uniref:Poly-beta-1,6-N-acetyl-D-glucosamine N-deacetylase PgaB n=1 Tax=Acinetobacter piscicola TaxID=2006115 RepID=A0A7S6VUR3_9GAMM|nr:MULTISPECIES: poly-beta-1,6-N-acetyl-D-glucosamine N-deacetylase PgaB [Acinetobacter]QOW45278.1 poly-beta-1,6-N-acetyl-D-glucosamine N-deacetylase PgaB [Acinetobacter piscicola]